MKLNEWAQNYVTQRARTRNCELEQLSESQFTLSNGERFVSEKSLSEAQPEDITIITLNTTKNQEILFQRWQEFITFRKLRIIFADLKTKHAAYWTICPATHHMISDPANLKKGIQSLAKLGK